MIVTNNHYNIDIELGSPVDGSIDNFIVEASITETIVADPAPPPSDYVVILASLVGRASPFVVVLQARSWPAAFVLTQIWPAACLSAEREIQPMGGTGHCSLPPHSPGLTLHPFHPERL